LAVGVPERRACRQHVPTERCPGAGVRLATFDAAKKLLESAEVAYAEEAARAAA